MNELPPALLVFLLIISGWATTARFALLLLVPATVLVIDPFVGSGTTALGGCSVLLSLAVWWRVERAKKQHAVQQGSTATDETDTGQEAPENNP